MNISTSTRAFIETVVRARDPEARFAQVQAIRFPLHLRGLFFQMHGNAAAFFRPDLVVTVGTRRRKVVFENFPRAGERTTYLQDRMYIENADGRVLENLPDPIPKLKTPLVSLGLQILSPVCRLPVLRYSPLQQAAFLAYAVTNYTLFPNNLTDEAQVLGVEKTGPHRLQVTYRTENFPTHSRVQQYEFDPHTHLLKLHRYRVAYVHPWLQAWHHTERHQRIQGIAFGDRRQIRLSVLGPAHRHSLRLIRAEVGPITLL